MEASLQGLSDLEKAMFMENAKVKRTDKRFFVGIGLIVNGTKTVRWTEPGFDR